MLTPYELEEIDEMTEETKNAEARNDLEGPYDISMEQFRKYMYEGGMAIRVSNPKTLWIKRKVVDGKEVHSHRIETQDGDGFYIKDGWLAIRWRNQDGEENAVDF